MIRDYLGEYCSLNNMNLSSVARRVQYQGHVLGNTTQISIEIDNSYKAEINFTLLGRQYSFTITSWKSRGLQRFLEAFHSKHDTPNSDLYGLMVQKANGLEFLEDNSDVSFNADGIAIVGPNCKPMTTDNKLNAVEKACRDIMTCLNQIGQEHQRSILEYCVWYRERPLSWTYPEIITCATANCVVHTNFMSPNVTWTLVEFQ